MELKHLYQKLNYLSFLCKCQATYYEMKYYLKQVLKGKGNSYLKPLGYFDRCIGKSVALARLSAKYNIPIIVPTKTWKILIERDIPIKLPKYFKKNKPTAIVMSGNLRSRKYDVLLVEETFNEDDLAEIRSITKSIIGYKTR